MVQNGQNNSSTSWGLKNITLICIPFTQKLICPDNSQLSLDGKQCQCKKGYYASCKSPLICTLEKICRQSCLNDCSLEAYQPVNNCPVPKCHPSCLQCAPNSDICIICPDQATLSTDKKQCICPANSQISRDRKRCECKTLFQQASLNPLICNRIPGCNPSCLQCNSSNVCIVCPPNSSVNPIDSSSCICNQGFIGLFYNNTLLCQPDNNIKICPDNSYLTPDNQCICYDGYYLNGNVCSMVELCSNTCAQCNNDGTCISCIRNDLILFEDKKSCRSPKCDPSCICDYTINDGCGSCAKCTRCRSSFGTYMVNQDYCGCLTPDYRRKAGSTWECEKVPVTNPPLSSCAFPLGSSISKMVVTSNCESKNIDNRTFLVNSITFDWSRAPVAVSTFCKSQIQLIIQYAKDGKTYVPFPSKYYSIDTTTYNTLNLQIPLIDLFDLVDNQTITEDGKIYQVLYLQIRFNFNKTTYRVHQFKMNVYTQVTVVQAMNINVLPQFNESCNLGNSKCDPSIPNLDLKGSLCNDKNCDSFIDYNKLGILKVGQNLFIRLEFLNNAFSKYLTVNAVMIADETGIYNYIKNQQFWVIRQELGYVDIQIQVYKPHINGRVELQVQIADQKELLQPTRRLEDGNNEDITFDVQNIYITTRKFQFSINGIGENRI